MRAKRFSKHDWITLGLSSLATGGLPALTIDALCDHSGKTRGSFYFHFETMEAFHLAIARQWQETFTGKIVASPHPKVQRKDLLNLLAARLDPSLETGIRQLAAINPTVRDVVATADRDRVTWLASLYRQGGAYAEEEAAALAAIEIAALAGFRLIEPEMTDQRARSLYESFLAFTGRA